MAGSNDWVGYWPDSGGRIRPDEWALSRAIFNGEITPEERIEIERTAEPGRATLEVSAGPVRDAAGKIIAGVVASVDVTERVRAEQAVRTRKLP